MRKPHTDQDVTKDKKKESVTKVPEGKRGPGSLPGVRHGGRQKGTPNKVTGLAKDAIAMAAEAIGGGARLAKWVKEDPANEKVFWSQIYTKLLPLQVHGEGIAPIMAVTKVVLAPLGEDEDDS